MKENHSYINGQFKGELKELWDNYVSKSCEFRVRLLQMNHKLVEQYQLYQ